MKPPPPTVEESYGLSPTQQGMLFHALGEPGSGVDVEQVLLEFDEPLRGDAFVDAFRQVIARHAILRTAFRWAGLDRPSQEVHREVTLPVERFDGSGLATDERESRLAALLDSDREAGFRLERAPLMRLTIVQIEPGRSQVLWTFHHALLDGRSFPLVLREVFAVYDAGQGGDPALGPPPRPYREYIDWLERLDMTAAERFWRDALRGFTAPTPLVVGRDRPDPDPPGGRSGVHEVRLPRDESAELREFARAHRVTPNTMLQAAWALLLHRYTGEEDLVFGATRACRRSVFEDAGTMIGLFINTLPIRVAIDPDCRVLPFLQSLREQQVALREVEHTPLYKVQAFSDVPGGTALFDSLVVYDNRTLDAMMHEDGACPEGRRFRYRGQTNFPLTVIGYGDESMLLRIEHDRRLFDDEPVGRMLDHLRRLLQQMVAFPERRLWELRLVSESELPSEEALAELPPGSCLHEQFEARAARQPEAIALTLDETRLSYAELNRRANRLAHRLRERGVGPDVLVGLCLERSIEMVVGILGILKAGGAYLPLDPTYPAERLAFMLEDSAVPVLVTAGEVDLPEHSAALVRVDEDEPAPETNPAGGAGPDHLAYVIYTSGSTGRPKGVPITHHNVDRLFRATNDWFHFDERDVWALFHSYAFDFSVWELWGALLYGGRLVVVPYWISRSPEAFLELVRSEQVTVLNQTPSAFRQLIQADLASGSPEATSLRFVIFGGEALELQSLRPWFERHGDERPQLVNMYGITETCVHVTYRALGLADLEAGLGSVIGVPIPDLSVYVLDPHGRPVPLGVPGEMYVGGAGVAPRGYLGRPELTSERFLDDPFVPGRRVYRTGDLARRLAGSELEYLGRIDHQVKIRGFRIELGEIESVLGQHAAVKECVVLAREDSPGDRRLVAYLSAAGDESLLRDELREAARTRLPDYMIPAAFVFLDTLPLTPNGKVDRKALPAPASDRPDFSDSYVAPRDESERALATIWADVLGVERVGIQDNFFELGGDSILAIQVITRARESGLGIDPRDLFRRPTVAELAAASTEAQPATRPAAGVPDGPIPATPIQHWFFDQRLPSPAHWNQSFLFELPANGDHEALERALASVVRLHPALRFRYRRDGERWIQTVNAEAEAPRVERIDLASLGDAEIAEAIESDAARRQASLDLTAGPLLRVVHYDLGSERPGRLLLAVHHLAVDGVSWRILMEDLDRAWQAEAAGAPVELPPEGTPFAEWSATLSELAAAGRFDESLQYWADGATAGAAGLADGDPTIEPTESRSRTVRVELDAETTGALLREVPAAYRTQINDVLLAALARVVGDRSGAGSCRIDLEGHGREPVVDGIDLSRTVGWFTTIYPLTLELPADAGPGDDLKSIKEQLRRVPDRGLSFGVLRYLADEPTRSRLAALPRPEILFNYLGRFDRAVAGTENFRPAAEPVGPWHAPQGRRTHPIEILARIADSRLRLEWTFTEGVHRSETIRNLADGYLDRLRELIEHARAADAGGVTPSDFPLAGLDAPALDRLPVAPRRIEELYPLAPMQQLFFSMESPGSTVGFEQWQFRLDGPVDPRALRAAWNDVVRRHAILRTAFVSAGLPRPLQLVVRDAEMPWKEEDWRDLDEDASNERLDEFLRHDLEQGFVLSEAPLLRVALFRTGEQRRHLVWSTHHLLVDGWSWPLIFSELSACYAARVEGRDAALSAPGHYRDYIAWLERHADRSASFWRAELDGFLAPTPADLEPPGAVAAGADERTLELSEEISDRLRARARERRLTLGAMAQGAWALLLAHYADAREVIFGAAFSGRPADVPGIASVVGPCVSNIPVRVPLARERSVDDWLTDLHSKLSELTAHQYASPKQIQEWSGIPFRHRLFESLLVFQNYLAGDESGRLGSSVRVTPLATPEATAYPWTLSVTPARKLRLRLLWPAGRATSTVAESILADLQTVFESLVGPAPTKIGDVLDALPAASRGRAAEVVRQRSSAAGALLARPAGAMETEIAAVWRELFQVEQIGVEQNFFDLGGHSLLLVQAHARLCEALGRELPIVDLLRFPTVRGLARHLSDEPTAEGSGPSARDRARLQREAMARRRPGPRRR